MISPRLIDRVERSLRKRLNIDVRAHLLRYATRAQSEEDFVASAGRLLLDPKQKAQWLASWAPRIHSESADTSPMPLDDPLLDGFADSVPPLSTAPANAPAGSPAAAMPTWIAETDWHQMREALAHELGPIAAVLLESEATGCSSATQLRDRLHAHLDTDEQRASFLRNTRHSG